MELNAVPTAGTSAPYGRACSTCARSKAKCITGNSTNAKCERCLRLNKDCQPVQTVRRRKTASRASNNQKERLEEKLDGLYKLLQSSVPSASQVDQTASLSTALISTRSTSESVPSHVPNPQRSGDVRPSSVLHQNWNPIDGLRPNPPTTAPDAPYVLSGTRSTAYHCPDSSLVSGLEPSSDQAEEYLNTFRPHMATYFPFILVPESTTAHELRRERPFLWLCVMSVAAKSTAQQKALGREVKIGMGREIIAEGKNNIDLLLGLLVFVAWGHYHIHDNPIIIQSLQLAIALAGNLGLNKPALKEPTPLMLNLDARGCPMRPSVPSLRTSEERRAMLGCFLLSSVTSYYFQRLDALRWTPYLDECMTVLAEEKDQPSDELLINLVRLQLIVEKVGRAPWHEGQNDATGSTRAPTTFYLKALQAQLQDFRMKLCPEIQDNEVLLLHLYSTEIKVHELALSKATIISNSPGFQQLDSLFVCLHATKKWFDLFLSLPHDSFVGFSISLFTQLAQCIITLFRLLTFDDSIWDRGLARETANLTLILEQVVQKLTQVKAVARLDHGDLEGKDIFSGTARTLESIKVWWDSRLAAESTNNTGLNETLTEPFLDFQDDMWLTDTFGGVDGLFDMTLQ